MTISTNTETLFLGADRVDSATDIDYSAIYEQALPLLEQRLDADRLAHSLSVAETAVHLAKAYAADAEAARLAGLLHDWDKCLPVEELIEKATGYGIEIPDRPEKLLHAFTGSRSVAELFDTLPQKVIDAIDKHTLAEVEMTDLDMIIYIADLLEPLRSEATYNAMIPLREQVGEMPLLIMYRAVIEQTLDYLNSKNRAVNPITLAAYDALNERIKLEGLENTVDEATPATIKNRDKSDPSVSRRIALLAAEAAYDKKATDIVVLNVRETLVICDYFVIVTGAINRQIDAICDAVEEKLRLDAGVKPIGREGLRELEWVLLDYGDVVVHVFQPELREFYRLEAMWGDSPVVDLSEVGITDVEYSERVARLLQIGYAEEEPEENSELRE